MLLDGKLLDQVFAGLAVPCAGDASAPGLSAALAVLSGQLRSVLRGSRAFSMAGDILKARGWTGEVVCGVGLLWVGVGGRRRAVSSS